MEINSKIVHRCLSVKGNALSWTNGMYRFHTYVRMVQDLHYSYFPKQLLRKDKTYFCLKNRKLQAEVTWNSILKQFLAYKTAGSGRDPKHRPSQFHPRIMSHATQPSVLIFHGDLTFHRTLRRQTGVVCLWYMKLYKMKHFLQQLWMTRSRGKDYGSDTRDAPWGLVTRNKLLWVGVWFLNIISFSWPNILWKIQKHFQVDL